tara:strand:- start:262 stop:480 length:219 start_codon:yes stop_codon:yes gene_type:complete
MFEPKHQKKRTQKVQNQFNKQSTRKQKKWKLNVLHRKLVTLAVIHIEMSALNARALANAVAIHVYVNTIDEE